MKAEELGFFLENGYLHVEGILKGEQLAHIQDEFDKVWDAEGPSVNQHKLLKYPAFIELFEHPPILDRHKQIFGEQIQLLQYDLLRQGPRSQNPDRMWHRDFAFPGDYPLSINTILYLDDITQESGNTFVVPRSHRGHAVPSPDQIRQPLPDEIAVHAKAGDAVFINSAIWHSGGCNKGEGLRRGIYLYYGYWWLKRYESDQQLPWQSLQDASEERLQLLGIKMPHPGFHQYR